MASVLLSGCTAVLWDSDTFADYHKPANVENLQLFYSKERMDILVRYDELSEKNGAIRPRCYWLERNTTRIERASKPHFSPLRTSEGLEAIPISEIEPQASSEAGISATTRHVDGCFTLYHGGEEAEYKLPIYEGRSRRVKQVALTPFAVAVDATIVGGVVAYYTAPAWWEGLGHR